MILKGKKGKLDFPHLFRQDSVSAPLSTYLAHVCCCVLWESVQSSAAARQLLYVIGIVAGFCHSNSLEADE